MGKSIYLISVIFSSLVLVHTFEIDILNIILIWPLHGENLWY